VAGGDGGSPGERAPGSEAPPAGARRLGDGTRVIHAGLPAPGQHEPFLPGPEFASPYHLSGPVEGADYSYGRSGNRTWTRFEAALAELEGGEALVFASGAAACAAVLLTSVGPGDVLVIPADGYPAVRAIARDRLVPIGVEVREAASGPAYADAVAGASFVWIESPSNPALDVCDVRAVCAQARAEGALSAVDNTLATPLGQRPLELGADFSVASDTKYVSGHSDLLLGHVAVRDADLAERLHAWRTTTGSIAGPFETWLAHRSLATLDVRLERQCATALALAEWLAARDDVEGVRYPGRPGDPAHELAAGQMTRFGSVISFDLGSRERAERFLDACVLVAEATSFGGVHSSAERRARWHGNDVGEGFIRLSVGCEDAADLIADVESALDA
jgi:cystathionine gamma-lyase